MIMQKNIFTIWLNDGSIPPNVDKWMQTHYIDGFKSCFVGFGSEFLPTNNDYINRALDRRNWVKAADYLRAFLLYKYGGVYIDADIEIIDNMPIKLLTRVMDANNGPTLICEREANGFIANSFIMALAGRELLKHYMNHIEKAHSNDDEVWNCGMGAWTDYIHTDVLQLDQSVMVLPPDTLFGRFMIHHYLRSWKKDQPQPLCQ